MLEFTLAALAAANKGTLREACRAHNVAYTTLNVESMREALAPFASDYVSQVVQPIVDAENAAHDAAYDAVIAERDANVPNVEPIVLSDAERALATLGTAVSDAATHAALHVAPPLPSPTFDASYVAAMVVPRDPRALFAATKPAKVEKVRAVRVPRAESNGVKRPADNTLCGRVWAWCDVQCAAGVRPEAKALRAALADIDPTTCTVQYYRWRKFNGIAGR